MLARSLAPPCYSFLIIPLVYSAPVILPLYGSCWHFAFFFFKPRVSHHLSLERHFSLFLQHKTKKKMRIPVVVLGLSLLESRCTCIFFSTGRRGGAMMMVVSLKLLVGAVTLRL